MAVVNDTKLNQLGSCIWLPVNIIIPVMNEKTISDNAIKTTIPYAFNSHSPLLKSVVVTLEISPL